MAASDSILTSIKKVLGLAEDYLVFDPDIIMHINTVFSTLTQLGVGPTEGFMIEDARTEWEDYDVGEDIQFNSVRSYMFLKVKMLFDPPQLRYLYDAMKDQIQELEWRLNVHREETDWTDPTPPQSFPQQDWWGWVFAP